VATEWLAEGACFSVLHGTRCGEEFSGFKNPLFSKSGRLDSNQRPFDPQTIQNAQNQWGLFLGVTKTLYIRCFSICNPSPIVANCADVALNSIREWYIESLCDGHNTSTETPGRDEF